MARRTDATAFAGSVPCLSRSPSRARGQARHHCRLGSGPMRSCHRSKTRRDGLDSQSARTSASRSVAVDYLKPATRRHGVLVITHHRDRKWLDPLTRKPLSFDAVIKWLSGIAETLVETNGAAIEARCVGINAWRELPTTSSTKTRSTKKSLKKAPRRTAKSESAGRR